MFIYDDDEEGKFQDLFDFAWITASKEPCTTLTLTGCIEACPEDFNQEICTEDCENWCEYWAANINEEGGDGGGIGTEILVGIVATVALVLIIAGAAIYRHHSRRREHAPRPAPPCHPHAVELMSSSENVY